MFSSSVDSLSTGMILFNLVLYIFPVIYTLCDYTKWPYQVCSTKKSLFWLFFLVFYAVTYVLDSDFFNYKNMVAETYTILEYGLEKVYQHIILFLNNNYLLFRIVVWGSASIIFFVLLKRYELDASHGLLLFLVVFGGLFSYARVSLAFSIFYLGLSFLSVEKGIFKKVLYGFIGLTLIFVSSYFHRSIIFLIALTPFFFFRYNKKVLFFIVLVSLIILYSFQYIWGELILLFEEDSVMTNRIDLYTNAESFTGNWKGVVGSFFHYSLYAVCLYIISMPINKYKNKKKVVSSSFYHLYTFLIALIFMAILSYVSFDGNIIFMNRLLKMTIIPITVLLTYLYAKRMISASSILFIIFYSMISKLLLFVQLLF